MSYCFMMGAEGCATQRGTQTEQEHGALGAQMSALQELQPKEDKRKARQKSLILLDPTPTKMVGSTKAKMALEMTKCRYQRVTKMSKVQRVQQISVRRSRTRWCNKAHGEIARNIAQQ